MFISSSVWHIYWRKEWHFIYS